MAIQQVSVSKYEDPLFFGDSVTVPRPADLQDDDFLVIWVCGFEEGGVVSSNRIITLPTGFSVAQAQENDHQSTAVMAVKRIEDIASEPADYTFTVSGRSWSLTAIAIAYRGVNETTPFSCEPYTFLSGGFETINFPDGQPITEADIYLAFYSRVRNEDVSWQPRLDENPEIERALTGFDTDAGRGTRSAAASFVTGTMGLITGQTATHTSRRYQSGSIVLHAAALPGITIDEIKEPNEANTLVDGVTNARVKVWYGPSDIGMEDDLFTESITNGTLTITGIEEVSLGDPVIVEVMWTVGSERKLFITETTIVDLEDGS